MKFLFLSFCTFIFILFSTETFAQNNVAMVKMAKGTFTAELGGKTVAFKEGQWIQQGTIIKTGDKSFVKLVFIDKSQINVGPKSEMKIETFSKNEPGLLSVVKGQIRSQVTKDLLNQSDKSKLQVTTKTAAMGVRGTDFVVEVDANSGKTELDVIEGRVQFAPITEGASMSFEQIETVLNNPEIAVPVNQGMGSEVSPGMTSPPVVETIPAQELKSIEQAMPMEPITTEAGGTSGTPGTTSAPGTGTSSGGTGSTASTVPPGLSAAAVYNTNAGSSIAGSLNSGSATGGGAALIPPTSANISAPLPPPPSMNMAAPVSMSGIATGTAATGTTANVTTAPPPPPVVNDVLGTTSAGPVAGAPTFFQPGTFFIDGGTSIKTDDLPTYLNTSTNTSGKTDVTIIVE